MLWLLFLVYVVHHLDRNILLLLQEPIRKEFALSDSKLGMLTGFAYALPFALAGIPFGALAGPALLMLAVRRARNGGIPGHSQKL